MQLDQGRSQLVSRSATVLVTGAAGRLGQAVTKELSVTGHRVIAVDRLRCPTVATQEWHQIDLLHDRLDAEIVAKCDAVVHLAALPDPSKGTMEQIIESNCGLVTRVVLSAMDAGIRKFIYASSQCVLGFPFADEVIPPDYLPVDEEHPCRPQDAYGLSKWLGENVCVFAARRYQASITCLRFPAIWNHESFSEHTSARKSNPTQAAKSMWAYIDMRDAARAISCILTASPSGFEIFNIAAPWPFADRSSRELVQEWYAHHSSAPMGADRVTAQTALFTSRKAEEHLGFRPRYRWHSSGIEEVP